MIAPLTIEQIDRQLQRALAEMADLLAEVIKLRGAVRQAAVEPPPALPSAPPPALPSAPSKYCTIEEFIIGTLGFASRISYYNKLKEGEPGWPVRRYIGKRPMLLREDCDAYVNQIEEASGAPRKKPLGAAKKRRVGRPVKSPEKAA